MGYRCLGCVCVLWSRLVLGLSKLICVMCELRCDCSGKNAVSLSADNAKCMIAMNTHACNATTKLADPRTAFDAYCVSVPRQCLCVIGISVCTSACIFALIYMAQSGTQTIMIYRVHIIKRIADEIQHLICGRGGGLLESRSRQHQFSNMREALDHHHMRVPSHLGLAVIDDAGGTDTVHVDFVDESDLRSLMRVMRPSDHLDLVDALTEVCLDDHTEC